MLESKIIEIVLKDKHKAIRSNEETIAEALKACHSHLNVLLTKDKNIQNATAQIVKAWDAASSQLQKKGVNILTSEQIRKTLYYQSTT